MRVVKLQYDAFIQFAVISDHCLHHSSDISQHGYVKEGNEESLSVTKWM